MLADGRVFRAYTYLFHAAEHKSNTGEREGIGALAPLEN